MLSHGDDSDAAPHTMPPTATGTPAMAAIAPPTVMLNTSEKINKNLFIVIKNY
jgi:hypothetical protein